MAAQLPVSQGRQLASAQLSIGFALLSAIICVLVVHKLFANKVLDDFYDSLPCPGRKAEAFSWLRATLRSFTDTPARVAEGYAKYGKSNIPFLVPNIRQGPVLAIPPAQLKTVLGNPESKLAAHEPQFESVSAKYTMRDPAIYPSNYEVDIVKKQITKRYGTVDEELADEIAAAFDDYWGKSSEWRTILAWDSLQEVAARAFNRVAVGLPLCRNEEFLKRNKQYSMAIQKNGPVIAMLPKFLKPVLGPLISWGGTKDCEAGIKMLLPLVEERLQDFERNQNRDNGAWVPPNDILQWLIEESFTTRNPTQMKARRIAHRLVILNFNSIPSTALTLANLLLDLYSTSSSEEFVDGLRKECNQVLAASPEGYWTKKAISQLSLIDSTIRESMRHSDFGNLAYPRRVSAPEGIEMANGLRVPKGVSLEIPMHSIHMDEDFYPEPTRFDAFRFSGSSPRGPKKLLVTLDDTFLTFGYGRNGCPGRFFGAHLMKTMLAYIIQNYDIEFMPERPKMVELMEFRFPSEATTVRIRRRMGVYVGKSNK